MKKRAWGVDSFQDVPQKLRFFGLTLILFLLFSAGMFMAVERRGVVAGFVSVATSLAFLHESTTPAGQFVQVFVAVIGAVLFWWIIWTIFDLIASEHFFDYLRIRTIEQKVRHMKNHIIVAGGGRVGDEIAHRLSSKKIPYVIIEHDVKKLQELHREKMIAIHGDAADAMILEKASVKSAKAIVLALPAAEKNLLVALLAKEQNPQIHIHARADTEDYIPLLKKAGVTSVVVPEVAAADQLMVSLTR